jgi:MFS family permease
VYGLLAVEIGATFFPQSSKELQLVNSFGVYLAAFVMRPIGAILFGEIGDRIVGRKHALVFSILLITIPSILMGVLPGYDTWGWISPILLVLLRMMQGLSVGGQLAGSYVLSIEQSSAKARGFRGSVCDASSVRIPYSRIYITLYVRLFVVFVLLNESVPSSLTHIHTHIHTLHILFNRLVDSCWHRW